MSEEILIAPCDFKLPNASVSFNALNDLIPHPLDRDKKLEQINKDDVLIILVPKKYPYDNKTLNDPNLVDETNSFLESENLESFDPENEKHMIILRQFGKDSERIQNSIKQAMSYYYNRSEKPKKVLPFSIPKQKITTELIKNGYISGMILLNSTTKQKLWISNVDLELLKKDIQTKNQPNAL